MHRPEFLSHPTVMGLRATTIIAALLVAACGDRPVSGPPQVDAAAPAASDVASLKHSVPGPEGDPSVPAASAALGQPSIARSAGDAANPAGSSMTKAQESTAMPMAGQANDHSTTAPKSTKP